ncbi:MAG: flagellar export protein FliJ [Spirochaetaceae bacterium]|nr:MAG: flagellar export protein FliJ [Spirochaetaceae bacterium]
MKRFLFSLNAVLRLREHREWEQELELGKTTSRVASIQNEINSLTTEYQNTVSLASGARAVDMEYRIWQTAYLSLLEQRRSECRRDLTIAEEARQAAQERYLEAMKERKVLTQLRERQESAYRREQTLHEENVIDDTNNARSARVRGRAVRSGHAVAVTEGTKNGSI